MLKGLSWNTASIYCWSDLMIWKIKCSNGKSNVGVNVQFIDHPKQKISAIININKYGSLIKVLKISFYVLKFVNIIYQKTFKKSHGLEIFNTVTLFITVVLIYGKNR